MNPLGSQAVLLVQIALKLNKEIKKSVQASLAECFIVPLFLCF